MPPPRSKKQNPQCECRNRGARTCPLHPNRAGDGASNPYNGKHFDCICQEAGATACPVHPHRLNPPGGHGTGKAGRRLALLIQRDGPHCRYCGVYLYDDGVLATTDHVQPLARGGSNLATNLTPACYVCNHAKGQLTEDEFRRYMAEGKLKIEIEDAQRDVRSKIASGL